MNLFKDNPDLYPTPKPMIRKMSNMIPRKDWQGAKFILEPSAGAGNILEWLKDDLRHNVVYRAIEKDPELHAMLTGKGFNVIDRDFLTYSGPDKYDIIIMNPPFSNGESHLLKAIDVMYSGHIVCLLNADTIRNPHTNARKMLVRQLDELDAEIELLDSAFSFADRKTDIDVAMVHIHIDRNVETDLFDGVTDTIEVNTCNVDETGKELTQNSIRDMVADYNRRVEIGTQTLIDYYKNYRHIGGFITIKTGDDERHFKDGLTDRLKKDLNGFLVDIRKAYWRKVLLLDKVREKMTVKKRKEFEKALQDNSFMDFTESNIRQFILNLINSYEDILTEATIELFDRMTRKHAWDEDLHNKNTHYFDGWKTNNAFMVNKKVIVPFFYQEAFWDDIMKNWRLGWRVHEELDDIDKVMNYFDGRSEYTKISTAIDQRLKETGWSGSPGEIESTYFKIKVYKKGTCHLTFKDEGIRRRFNVTACRGKGWLPQDYGTKKYKDLDGQEQAVVDSFEGSKTYDKNVVIGGRSLFQVRQALQIHD